jgi:uncharacterized protein
MPSHDLQGTSLAGASLDGSERGLGAYALRLAPLFGLSALGVCVSLYFRNEQVKASIDLIAAGFATRGFWTAAAVGLFAQIVDGALGMAYGITSSAFLLSTGVPPAAASASVHIAEVFTTGFSGLSHWRLGNVHKPLFKRLLVPGVLGAVLGAYIVTSIDGKILRPWISSYLLLMGLYVLFKAFRPIVVATEPPTYVAPLALVGGFVDAVGGGGWGPVVTTSLLGSGHEPRRTIGSVNAAEFFLALAGGVSFALMGAFTIWTTIAGLIFGGMFAAPLAAVLTRRAPTKLLLVIVGLLISGISAHNLWQALS